MVILSILIFLFILTVLVVLHEGGHFFAARWFGVRVQEFGIGLPPKAKVMWKRKGTEYTLNWLPLGGFVRLHGEGDLEGRTKKDGDSFMSKKVYQRIIIAGAGVVVNALVAYLLLVFLFLTGFMPLGIVPDNAFPLHNASYSLTTESFAAAHGIMREDASFVAPVSIHEVMDESQAQQLGLSKNSYLLRINDMRITSPQIMVEEYAKVNIGDSVTLDVLEDGNERRLSFVKQDTHLGVLLEGHSPYVLTGDNYHEGILGAFVKGGEELRNLTVMTWDGLSTLGSSLVHSFRLPDEIGGPVQVAETVHVVTERNSIAMGQGVAPLLLLMAIISLNLAMLNLLPIPALDGGRIVFLLIEGITRKPVPPKIEVTLHYIGYILLLLFMIAITVKDVVGML